jgi:N-methylhydantoinase A
MEVVNKPAPLSVSIDIGGTFTDVTLLDRTSGEFWKAKTPSTPADPSIGFMNGISQLLEEAGRTHEGLGQVVHGTTVATNLILEDKGAVTGLLTSTGFRHVLEIGRHDIPRGANLYSWVKPIRPVPVERIYEIGGLCDHRGRELEPLAEEAVRIAVDNLRGQGVEAVAICFRHAYANPAQERRAKALVLEEWPGIPVTISSDVLPVSREFERSMATILNAYVMPAVSTYVERLEDRLSDKSVTAPLLLMKSNGGVAGAKTIRREPVQTALSGPAAGVVGMQLFAGLSGFPNVIGVDIGGTSADISLIKQGEPGMTMRGKIGEWPLTLPMIDINTIGAGGGSIARVSADGLLTVGPDSAGAEPGPVCYGRGGTEPTVTDAHAVLGHLPPSLLDGRMSLDVEGSRRAIESKIARPLGFSVENAARGILALADNAMVGIVRVVSVERGLDPRDFALVPFGGAGPLHGCALARLLGMETVLLPPSPGVLSAIGLLVSNLRSDFQRTCIQKAGQPELDRIGAIFADMVGEATRWFDAEQVPKMGRNLRLMVSMHYEGQGYDLLVPWSGDAVDSPAFEGTIEYFHRLHEDLYTFAQRDVAVELTTLHVEATGSLQPPVFPMIAAGGDIASAIIGRQIVHFAEGSQEAAIYDRTRLGAGNVVEGPAIFVQLDTTTIMLPGQVATVDPYGSLIIRDTFLPPRPQTAD